jgi:hypothetical protein
MISRDHPVYLLLRARSLQSDKNKTIVVEVINQAELFNDVDNYSVSVIPSSADPGARACKKQAAVRVPTLLMITFTIA